MSQAPILRNTLKLADTPNSVTWARRHTVDVLRRWGILSEDVLETARLVVSELATNAVRHPEKNDAQGTSYSDFRAVHIFELLLEITDTVVRVSVWDRDPTPPQLKEVRLEESSGRGIFIVANVSARWGHYRPSAAPGKVVWAEVPMSTSSSTRDSAMASGAPPTRRGEPAESSSGTLRTDRVLTGLRGH